LRLSPLAWLIKLLAMDHPRLQQLCEQGAEQLVRTEYLAAIDTLNEAEQLAWAARDFDTLSRVHMPLQEAQRQARLRCLEGTIALNLLAGPEEPVDVAAIVDRTPRGQLLIGGWGTAAPAAAARRLAWERRLYLEVFLAAVFPLADAAPVAVVLPSAAIDLPPATPRRLAELAALLPATAVIINSADLPAPVDRATPRLEQFVLELWERLHAPFLAAAEAQADLLQRIVGYRATLEVDPACELAHQNLSIAARAMGRCA
jgi:hypothetical protein